MEIIDINPDFHVLEQLGKPSLLPVLHTMFIGMKTYILQRALGEMRGNYMDSLYTVDSLDVGHLQVESLVEDHSGKKIMVRNLVEGSTKIKLCSQGLVFPFLGSPLHETLGDPLPLVISLDVKIPPGVNEEYRHRFREIDDMCCRGIVGNSSILWGRKMSLDFVGGRFFSPYREKGGEGKLRLKIHRDHPGINKMKRGDGYPVVELRHIWMTGKLQFGYCLYVTSILPVAPN